MSGAMTRVGGPVSERLSFELEHKRLPCEGPGQREAGDSCRRAGQDHEWLTLKDLSPLDLADAADANLVTHAGWLQRRLSGMRVIDQDDLVLIDSGLLDS